MKMGAKMQRLHRAVVVQAVAPQSLTILAQHVQALPTKAHAQIHRSNGAAALHCTVTIASGAMDLQRARRRAAPV